MDLKIHPRTGDLIIGTFGRAAYILDDIAPLRELAKQGVSLLDEPFHVFPAQEAMITSFKSIQGVRFTADAHYKGQNRSGAAMIYFYLKDVKQEEEEQEGGKGKSKELEKKEEQPIDKIKERYKGKVRVNVISGAGDTIRTYSFKPDTGLNRTYWAMNRDLIQLPQYGDMDENADLPGGRSVMPGTYTVVLTYGDYSGSTKIKVAKDLREDVSEADLKVKGDAHQALMHEAELATASFERLKDINKTVARVNKHLQNLEADSVRKDIEKAGEAITKKTSELINLYLEPEDFVGYDHITLRIMDVLWTAADYIESSKGAPTQTALDYSSYAIEELYKVVARVNKLVAEDWAAYQKKVEAVEVSLFKTFVPIEHKK